MLRLFLLRHGPTEENLRGEIQGHRPGTLTEAGRRWAGEIGRRLRPASVGRIYSSDLARARETASIVAQVLGAEVVETPLLRERGYGELEGRRKAEAGFDYPDLYGADLPERGVEPLASVVGRLRQFLDGLLDRPAPRTLLLVAHGGTLSYLTNLLLEEGRVMRPASNEVVSILLDGSGRAVEYVPSWNGA